MIYLICIQCLLYISAPSKESHAIDCPREKIITNFCEGPLFWLLGTNPGNGIHQIWDLQLMIDGWWLSLVCEEVHGPIAESRRLEGFVLQRLQPKWTRNSANDLSLEMACNIVGLIYYLLVSSILLLIWIFFFQTWSFPPKMWILDKGCCRRSTCNFCVGNHQRPRPPRNRVACDRPRPRPAVGQKL